jgi:hypothetical protein
MNQADTTGLVAFLAPEGVFGAQRKCVVEIKAGPGLVIPLDPGSVVIEPDRSIRNLPDKAHITIHSSLMVHVREEEYGRRHEIGPGEFGWTVPEGPRVLCVVGAGDPRVVEEYVPVRPQTSYQGAAILSVPVSTEPLPNQQVAVQIWSIPIGESVPVVAPTPEAAPAPINEGLPTFGPMVAELAFKWRPPPPCWFGFATWWISAAAASGRPFVAADGTYLD